MVEVDWSKSLSPAQKSSKTTSDGLTAYYLHYCWKWKSCHSGLLEFSRTCLVYDERSGNGNDSGNDSDNDSDYDSDYDNCYHNYYVNTNNG